MPFTDPGGTPCCCLSCPPDQNADNALNFEIQNRPLVEVTLTEDQYANIAAGGTWNVASTLGYSFVRYIGDPRSYELISSDSFTLNKQIQNTFGVPFPSSIWEFNTTGINFECLRLCEAFEDGDQVAATERVLTAFGEFPYTYEWVETQISSNVASFAYRIAVRLYDIGGVKSAKVMGQTSVAIDWNVARLNQFFGDVTFSGVTTNSANSFIGIPMTVSNGTAFEGSLALTDSVSCSGTLVITLSSSAP